MSVLEATATGCVAGLLARQLMVLAAVVRSARFLTNPPDLTNQSEPASAPPPATGVWFFVVLPVLRESTVIADAVGHFQAMLADRPGQLFVVTTERERAEERRHPRSVDTVQLVEELARRHRFTHLHYPDPTGLKADQLNHAAGYCRSALPADVGADRAFLLCYDADSRPPLDSIDRFWDAIRACGPDTGVFHQSSSFQLRAPTGRPRSTFGWLGAAVGQGAALRANRFVTGFEIPRLLNRSPAAGPLKRRLCSLVYAHVTGHGLCVRLSLLADIPFPARSPLEDMHWSFLLCSRTVPMVAVASLDRAEVPDSPAAQVRQAARWFVGPARALRYLHDPATVGSWRARLLAMSALGSALEWLGCAVVPAGLVLLAAARPGPVAALAAAVAVVYAAQLLLTDRALGAPARWSTRAVRLMACPVAATLHGLGGLLGAVSLMTGGTGVGKTERA